MMNTILNTNFHTASAIVQNNTIVSENTHINTTTSKDIKTFTQDKTMSFYQLQIDALADFDKLGSVSNETIETIIRYDSEISALQKKKNGFY